LPRIKNVTLEKNKKNKKQTKANSERKNLCIKSYIRNKYLQIDLISTSVKKKKFSSLFKKKKKVIFLS